MASIDKAAIGFSMAIVAVGVAFAVYGGSVQDSIPALPVQMQESTDMSAQMKQAAEKAAAEKMMAESDPAMEDLPEEVPVGGDPPAEEPEALSVTVEIPMGTAVPGCETTSECYIPEILTINAGDTVNWDNVDTAAHTVTSGSPKNGPSGEFDSSLILGGAVFSNTFEEAGTYDYFCMVHPWMVGKITVS